MTGPIIAVYSPKGGVGKTLLACGLAMTLARRSGRGAVLVDLDANKADVGPLLQCSLRPSILDFPPETDGAPDDRSLITLPGGLSVLPGPTRLVDEHLVTRDLAEHVLHSLAHRGQPLVIDTGCTMRDSTLIALEKATAVLLVVTPDLLSIYPARRFVQETAMIGLKPDKFRLVINRTTDRQPIPNHEITDLLELIAAGTIPSLPGLAHSVNSGLTAGTMRMGTLFGAATNKIADNLSFAGVHVPARAVSRRPGPRWSHFCEGGGADEPPAATSGQGRQHGLPGLSGLKSPGARQAPGPHRSQPALQAARPGPAGGGAQRD